MILQETEKLEDLNPAVALEHAALPMALAWRLKRIDPRQLGSGRRQSDSPTSNRGRRYGTRSITIRVSKFGAKFGKIAEIRRNRSGPNSKFGGFKILNLNFSKISKKSGKNLIKN